VYDFQTWHKSQCSWKISHLELLNATIILRHLSSSVAAKIDTILSCCHHANIFMWKTSTYTFVPVDNIFKKAMLHPRWALHSITMTLCVFCDNSFAATNSYIYLIMHYDICNIEQSETRHCTKDSCWILRNSLV
jgi:hypothetical protein